LGIRNAGLQNLDLKVDLSLLLTVFGAETGADSSVDGVTSSSSMAASLCNLNRCLCGLGGALSLVALMLLLLNGLLLKGAKSSTTPLSIVSSLKLEF
jgi:hypothetical protein